MKWSAQPFGSRVRTLRRALRHPWRGELLYREIVRTLDEEAFEAMAAEILKSGLETLPTDRPPDAAASAYFRYEKYLDFPYYLRLNIARALELGLHRGGPLRVLDIGCGAGYFLVVCRHLGHAVQGLDMEIFPLFNRLIRFFGLSRIGYEIRPLEPIPPLAGEPFDLITAHAVQFDRMDGGGIWKRAEWEYFLASVRTKLAPGGRFAYSLNPGRRYASRDPEVFRLFANTPGFTVQHVDRKRVLATRID
jgi:SAM-dependent methyltransferase